MRNRLLTFITQTRLMSETTTSHIMPTMKQMWAQGGIKTFYRGLIVSLFDLSGQIIAHLCV